MERTRTFDVLQLPSKAGHPVADHPPVGFDLGFAGAAQKAESAALTFKVGPASNQPTRLIIQMSQFHLKAPFRRSGTFTEDFEDQPGPVDGLKARLVFKVSLLDGRQTGIDNQQVNFEIAAHLRNFVYLPPS